MANIQITHRFTGTVLFEGNYENKRAAVVAAVSSGANLSEASLSEANLIGANLSEANLSEAIMPSPDPATSLHDAAIKVRDWLRGRWIQKNWIQTPHGAYAGDCKACLHGAAIYMGGDY